MSSAGASRSRPRLTARAAVLAAIVLALAATLVVPLRQYLSQRSDIAELERRVELLREERDRLDRHAERLRDPTYLERYARQCLGMVKPGEIAFVAVPEDGALPLQRC